GLEARGSPAKSVVIAASAYLSCKFLASCLACEKNLFSYISSLWEEATFATSLSCFNGFKSNFCRYTFVISYICCSMFFSISSQSSSDNDSSSGNDPRYSISQNRCFVNMSLVEIRTDESSLVNVSK